MALEQLQILPDGSILNKVELAIRRLKAFEPPDGYYVAFSGGKDSQCVYHLCKMAGVKFDAHYARTSVDPPELIYFLREHYPDVEEICQHYDDGKPEHYYPDGRPKPMTMWSLIADHTIPPTRKARYCCASLKEPGGAGRVVVTGVRWAESANRAKTHGAVDVHGKPKSTIKKAVEHGANFQLNKHGEVIMNDDNDSNRKMVESCYRTQKTMVNPIVDWTEEDVWEFLNSNHIPHCSLYDEGFTRLGCIGCPLAGAKNMERDFERWPKYKENYIRAFQRMIDSHPGQIKILREDYVPKNVQFEYETLKDETVPGKDSGGGYGSTYGSGFTDDGPGPKMGAGGIQSLGRDGCDVVPPQKKIVQRYNTSTGGRNAATLDKPTVTDRGKSGSGTTNQPETECSEYGQRHAAPDTPPRKFTRYGSTHRTDGWIGGCRKADGMVDLQYELTTGETVCEWWTEREEESHYLIFTLNDGETWKDKEEDIRETIRRNWKK